MQQSKPDGKLDKHKASTRKQPTLELAVVIFGVAMFGWLFSTSYILGQLEIKHSRLVLTSKGCAHLQQYDVTLQPIAESGNCTVDLPFRPNLFNDGGIARTGLGIIRLPECQLISYMPLAEQHWLAERWPLLLWEATCLLLLVISMWLLWKVTVRRKG